MRNWIALLFIALSSCEMVVQPNLPDDGAGVVVYSFFRPEAPIQIDVFNTVSIYEKASMNRARGLTILLYENDELVESIMENGSGTYIGVTVPQPGKEYRFTTQAANTSIAAQSSVPEAVSITNATFSTTIKDINIGEYGYPAEITFTDPANEVNYYTLEVFVDDCADGCDEQGISGELNELLIEDVKVNTSGNVDIEIGAGPEGIDGSRYLYLTDNGFNGQPFSFKFYVIPTLLDMEESPEAIIKFVLKSVTEDYYNYLITSDYQKQIEDEGILAEPVQVYTNIQNGLGVFAGYNYSIISVKVD